MHVYVLVLALLIYSKQRALMFMSDLESTHVHVYVLVLRALMCTEA